MRIPVVVWLVAMLMACVPKPLDQTEPTLAAAIALWKAHQKFGSKPWRDLLTPAIADAERGIGVSGVVY